MRHELCGPGRARLRAAVWAGAVVFLTCGYFQNTRPGWNVNTQLALACALAERGTWRIDAYLEHPALRTGDYALVRGHAYSDKSPVTSLLAAPVVWLVRQAHQLAGLPLPYARARWWAGWLVAGGAAAALAALLALLLARRGVPPGWAAAWGGGFVLATPLFGYALLLFNYLPALALAMGGWLAGERALDGAPARRWLLAGLLGGLATWCLNTAALIPLALGGVLLAGVLRRRQPASALLAYGAGGLLGVAGHFVYTWAIFRTLGSPYQFEADPFFREQMARGLMGATRPRALVAWLVTFHPYKGLFVWWPAALLALGATLWLALRRRGPGAGDAGQPGRALAWAALGVLAALVLYNSAYFMWWGGWAYAPRHLLPALPPLALGLAVLARTAHARWLGCAVLGLGILLNVPLAALDPQFPPLLEQAALLAPERVAAWPVPQWQQLQYVWRGGQVDANLGTRLGLSGPASLLPLLCVWLAALWLLPRPEPQTQNPKP